jgi:hypothetical protein
MTKQDKANLRSAIFRHLDGIATAPTAYTLLERGVLQYLLDNKVANVTEIAARFRANEGYLNVGLRILASHCWLDAEVDNACNKSNMVIMQRVPLPSNFAGSTKM